MKDEILEVVVMKKGRDLYIYIYGKKERVNAMRTVARHASNPDLNIDWIDAAKIADQMVETAKMNTNSEEPKNEH